MDHSQIFVFIIASLAVILTPGQDVLLVMSRAVSQGARAGVITASGVSLGLLLHTFAAACGLGALLLASEKIFVVIKFLGAAYLLYLGFRMLTGGSCSMDLQRETPSSVVRLITAGFFSNISNPHVTIFFLAFLPQFIARDASHPALVVVQMGVCFACMAFMVKGPIGFFAGSLADWFSARPQVMKMINRVGGLLFLALACKLLTSQRG